MTVLKKKVLTYNIDEEVEADDLVEKAKQDHDYKITKTEKKLKVVKSKGQVIDQYYIISITQEYIDIE